MNAHKALQTIDDIWKAFGTDFILQELHDLQLDQESDDPEDWEESADAINKLIESTIFPGPGW